MKRENGEGPPIPVPMPMVELKSNLAMLSQDVIGVETLTAEPSGRLWHKIVHILK